jgi:hypothetical protein
MAVFERRGTDFVGFFVNSCLKPRFSLLFGAGVPSQ